MGVSDGVQACVFDAYGTLFDVHAAVRIRGGPLGELADGVSALWRAKQLEYTWLRSLMRRHADFWQVTGDALAFALESHGISDRALHAELMEAYRRLDCYPEVPGVLARLKSAGVTAVVLSNGSPRMLRDAVESAGLAASLQGIYSVEDVGVYKPHPRVYALAGQRLGIPREEMLFFSANAWDVAGAASAGLRAVWVKCAGGLPERLPASAEAVVGSLAELPGLLGLPEQGAE